MNTEEFVNKIKHSVIESNQETYRFLLSNTTEENASDEYWKKLLKIFHSLSPNDQEFLLMVMKQVSVDTLSNLFGILDGSSEIGAKFEDFELIHKNSKNKINNDLQDTFMRENP